MATKFEAPVYGGMVKVGMNVTARTGSCIGVKIRMSIWNGTIVKLLKNGFKMHFTEYNGTHINEELNYKYAGTRTEHPVDRRKLPVEKQADLYRAVGRARMYGDIEIGGSWKD